MRWVDNVSSLQLFQVMRFGTLILIGIMLVKAGYSTDEIGVYELFFFFANVVSFFWVMGLNNGLISFYPDLPSSRQKSLLFNLGILLLSFSILAGGFLYAFELPIAHLAGLESGEIPNLGWIIAYMMLSSMGNYTEYYYLLQNQSRSIIVYGVTLFAIQFILMAFGVLNGYTIEALVKLMVIWALLKFIWFWVQVLRFGSIRIDLKLQWLFLGYSLPLIMHMLLGNGMEYVDGFIVNHFFDESTFAQFRYGARELPLATVLIGAVSTALIPLAVTNMDFALSEVKKKISRLSNVLFPVSIILMLLSPILFPLIYSEDYRISAQIFNIYLLVIGSRILMPQVVIFAKRNNLVLMISAMIELVINIVLSLWFLRLFGILGIAWATVIAYLINKLILLLYAWVKHGVRPRAYLNVKLYAIWLSLLVITYYISTFYMI